MVDYIQTILDDINSASHTLDLILSYFVLLCVGLFFLIIGLIVAMFFIIIFIPLLIIAFCIDVIKIVNKLFK